MKNSPMLLLLVVVLFALSACQPVVAPAAQAPAAATESPAAEMPDIVDTAVAAGSFTTLVAAVQAAELVETLKGEGPFTVFAPSDEAFAKIDKATLDALLADPQGQLTQILLYHVLPGKVMAAAVTDGLEAETAQGGKVKFSVKEGKVMINDATIVSTDIEAANGVIHVIDTVIMPTVADGEAMTETAAAVQLKDLVDTAVAAGSFTTLVAAVQAAELVDTLKGEGPFTVFAPSDEAFAALPEGTVAGLLEDPKGALTDILLHHVVSGQVMAADVLSMNGQEVETVGGGKLTIMVEGDKVMLHDGAGNTIQVVSTDIATSNGVIHVIDGVLMPK
jgi:uncharacterized surface protein with fasciclin (FAS1) repeats